MKRLWIALLGVAFVAAGVVMPAYADNAKEYFGRSMFTSGKSQPGCPPTPELAVFEEDVAEDPSGEAIIFDALILRPLGIASMAAGLGGAIVSAPWAESSCSWDVVQRQLLEKPFNYTFCRKLGNIFDE